MAIRTRKTPRKGRGGRVIGRDDAYSLSTAKTFLGRLLDKAENGDAVYILRGRRRFVVQPVAEIEPVPMRPPGYFAEIDSADEIAMQNRLAEHSPVAKPEDLE